MATAWIDWMFPKSEDWVAPMHLHNDLLRPLVLRCIMMNIKMIQIKKTMTKIIKISHCLCILMRPLHSIIPFVSWRFAVFCCLRPYCLCFRLDCRFGCCLCCCCCCVVLYLSFGLGAPTPGIARVPFDSNMRRPADSPGGRKRYTLNRVLLLLVLVGVGDIIE